MSAFVDPTDVPPVCPAALALAMSLAGPTGSIGLADLDHAALARIEAALWSGGPPCASRTSVMLRLSALATALAGLRFATMRAASRPDQFARALKAAATLRLNTRAGLNPLRLMWAMTDTPAPVAVLTPRPPAEAEPLPLAA